MAGYSRGVLRDQVAFVRINPIFLYGWKTIDLAARTGISAADITTTLGHLTPTAAAAINGAVMVTGANSPKPARVVKKDPTAPVNAPGSTSTYLGYDRLAAALAAGWTLAGRNRGVNLTANVPGKRSVSAIATLSNGLRYVFPLNKADFDRVKGALGLQDAAAITTDTERRTLVTGSRSKPGKAAQENGGGVFSTFYSTDALDGLGEAGFTKLSDEFVEFAANAAAPGP